MALQDLSLPVDVPWTLIATSKDMLASHADRFPHAMWRNSLAVFKYDPDPADLPEVDEYQDRAITFLKVVASITSYTPGCIPCPPIARSTREDYGNWQAEEAAWEAKCHEVVHQSYPCAGALMQVAVYPKNGDTTDVADLAYFAAFEPKKRELIEAATESGEAVTQSKSDLNVRKGVTSTQSTEDLNVFTGMNLSAGAGGASAGVGVSGQWGTIKKSGTQQEDVTNTDASRELREVSSHTTSLSQLYHLLNSYHLGTNRAIFFVQPRPHTLQQKDQFTFINGPQEIEGVQEFFLVVSRPKAKEIDDYCVDALLYTGHLDIIAMQNAINEPKTAETEWIELWAMKPPLPGGYSVWNPEYWFEKAEELTSDVLHLIEDAAGISGGTLPPDIKFVNPAILDCYITPASLNTNSATPIPSVGSSPTQSVMGDNGWRIDRTRGLGGYDLWEDPNNRSADFRGKKNDQTAKAQGYVDVVSIGSPDNLANYQPDYALRLRALAWPWENEQATYHCRIKAYFIRNDLPTTQRSVNMFVTARGVSNCPDSPFADLEPTNGAIATSGGAPDIAADAVIHPPSIAPWLAASTPAKSDSITITNADSDPSKQIATAPRPILFSNPSGLNHPATGAARAKMANAVSGLVRTQLVSALACLPRKKKPTRFNFAYTDLYAQRMLQSALRIELEDFAPKASAMPELSKAILRHSASSDVLGAHSATLKTIKSVFEFSRPASRPDSDQQGKPARDAAQEQVQTRKATERRPKLDATKIEIRPLESYPVLTLHESRMDPAVRKRLASVGIRSGLDLASASASAIARRAGIDVDAVREIRLQLIGFPPDEKDE